MGLSIYDYHSMTERQYVAACKGHQLRMQQQIEPIRFLTWITFNANVAKEDRLKKPEMLWQLPLIDGSSAKESMPSKEEIKRMFERLTPTISQPNQLQTVQHHSS